MTRAAALIAAFSLTLIATSYSPGNAETLEQVNAAFRQAVESHKRAGSKADLRKAARNYERFLRIYSSRKHRAGVAAASSWLAKTYEDLGDHDRALAHYEVCLEIKRKMRDRKSERRILRDMAKIYLDMQQYDRAVEYSVKCLALSKAPEARNDKGYALIGLGRAYYHRRQYNQAIECFQKSLDISRNLKDRRREAQNLDDLGETYYTLGQYDKARRCLAECSAIYEELGNGARKASLYGKLAQVCLRQRDYANAEKYEKKSLAHARQAHDRKREASALYGLFNIERDRGHYTLAFKYLTQSLVIYDSLKDRKGEANVYLGLGDLNVRWHWPHLALEHYRSALRIAKEIKDRKCQATALSRIALAHFWLGQYPEAIECHSKSLTINRELQDEIGEASELNNLATIYEALGQRDKALALYSKALIVFERLKDRKAVATLLSNIGNICADRGDYKRALPKFKKALALRKEIGVDVDQAASSIACIYMDMGDLKKAEEFIQPAGSPRSLGRLRLMKNDYEVARLHYEDSLKLARQAMNAEEIIIANTGLGIAYEGTGDYNKSAEYYRKAVQSTEDLRSTLTRAQRTNFLDVRKGGFYRTAPYEGLARVLMRMNKPGDALRASEYTRARAFAEALSRLPERVRLDVPEAVMKRDGELIDRLAALKQERQKAYKKAIQERIKALEPQVQEKEKELTAHIEMLRKKYPLFAATKYPEPMDLGQTALKEDEWVISYDVTDPGVIIYLTQGRNLVKAIFKDVPRKELDALVRRLREPFELGPGDKLMKKLGEFDFVSGKKLADILLGDMLADLPENTAVIIVPDDSLGVLPFEMLVLNDGGKVKTDKKIPYVSGAQFFGDRNPISYTQSITALTLARTLGRQKQAAKKCLVLDDPVFDADDDRVKRMAPKKKKVLLASLPDKLMSIKTEIGLTFPPLPLTGELGKRLKEIDPGRTDEYSGLKAAKPVLFKRPLDKYGSMVFATHGYFGKDLPGIQEPVLVLTLVGQPEGKDGFLRMSEVMGLKMNADIVALTACQTGLGRRITGEGTMGMGRAFQYAGAKSVLMSLWSVAEASSVKLVESFFKHLKEGKSKLDALRLARQEIREAGYDHPFYWAPFILVGEAD